MTKSDNPDQHPIEKALGIDAGSTLAALAAEHNEKPKPELPLMVDTSTGELTVKKLEVTEAELEREDRYDDLKIEQHLDDLHRKAIDAFESQHRLSQEVDPKFSARNAEVAAQYLNIALNTVNSRVDSKYKRAKVRIAKGNVGKPNQVQNNVIVADRNSVLAALFPEKAVNEDQ